MLVKDIMTRHPVLVLPTMQAAEAQNVMGENKVRHLPIVGDGKRLLGLVTRQSFAMQPDVLASLDVWEITRFLSGVKVEDIMVPAEQVLTIDPNRTVERAAHTMTTNKIGCLPVIEDDVVTGIITEIDLLNAFQDMLGLPSTGVRATVRMPDRPGEFAKLTMVLAENKMGVTGIGTYPAPRHPGFHDAVLKIPGRSSEEVKKALSQVADQEVIDVRDTV